MTRGSLLGFFVAIWCPFYLVLFLGACSEGLPQELADVGSELPEVISYNFHVKPILSDRCFTCHGPDEARREAGLRLDDPKSAFAALTDHPDKVAIDEGKIERSEVYHRIMSDDAELVMPPPESNLALSDYDKAIIAKWIMQGARYESHWSFQPLVSVRVPEPEFPKWSNNEIDLFIGQKLKSRKFQPSLEADRSTLIRRLSFDLTGLPPTPAQVQNFVNSNDPNAYEVLVDQFLADHAYGERMAADWMDVARYADSDGYLDDKHRSFSPYRDWVIRAFNENMAYDDFVTWQLAGDLLPDPTQEQILATAFNRLHKRNTEAGIVFEEYRVEYVADKTHTFSKAFLGLSVECARCHDHKYDPISQDDYYGLFAFFNSTNEFGSPAYGPDQTPGPALLLSTAEQQEMIDFISKEIEKGENEIEDLRNENSPEVSNWISNNNAGKELAKSYQSSMVAFHDFDHVVRKKEVNYLANNLANSAKPALLKEPILKPGFKGKAFFVNDYNTITLGKDIGWFERTDPFSIELKLYPAREYEEAGILTHCEDLRLGYKGYSLHLENNRLRFIIAHSWPQNALEVVSVNPIPVEKWSQVTITYDGSSRAEGIGLYLDGERMEVETVVNHLYKGILYEKDIHTYGFRGFALGYRDKIITFKDGGIDDLKIFDDALTDLEVLYGFDSHKAMGFCVETEEGDLVADFFNRKLHAQTQLLGRSLHQMRNDLNSIVNEIPEIMVMGDLDEPKPTYVLDRGMYDAMGQQVQAHTPDEIFQFSEKYPENRLGLAQWLFDPQNPLTARVMVNRIWQMHFGSGLVKTAEDFGAQGDLPSHPELLDWLANYFIDHNWDIKKLHRLIVSSATYRQSSVVLDEHLEKDPENKWLARSPSPRLTAEMIRDQALAVSELLVKDLGGPSVYPYQPDGLWDELSNKSWRYPYLQEPGDGLYRRSIYTIFKRTSPPPSMLIFDVPDRSACTVRRTETSTPLQALVLLNDPQFVEASKVLAQHSLKKGNDPQELVRMVFSQIIGRQPTGPETESLLKYYNVEYEHFRTNPKKATDYLSVGESRASESVSTAELAALAITCNSILNTAEAQTRR